MSYQSDVLADNPALFLRLDKTGTDTDGDSWPDLSGNGLNATQVYSGASDVARGFTSPIETDGASREFYGWTNALSPHSLEGTSRLYVPNNSLIQPAGDFTVECWIRSMGGMWGATNIPLVGKKNTCGIMWAFSGGQRFAGYCYDSNGTLWTVTDLSFKFDDFLGTSFFVAVKRTGTVLALLINATLRAVTNISSGLGTRITTDAFFVHPDVLNYQEARYDEAAFYTHSLTDDRILVHYEAALLNPPINAIADLRMIATIDGDDEPTPQLFPFSHNWESEVRETLAWLTDIIPAEQDYEQRAAIRQRPQRELEFDAFVGDNKLRRRFHAYLFQNQRRTIYLGDWTDVATLTADVLSGATSLSFVSARLGFENGGLLAIFQDEDNFEILKIDTVGATSTTLATPTANGWTKTNAFVVPVVRAIVAEDLQFDRHTDQLETSKITFRVLAEDVPLAPRRNGTYTPRYTYQGIEVFDPFVLGTNNWSEDGKGRVTLRTVDPESSAGIFSRDPHDTASREITSYSFFLDGRAEISQFLAWAWSIQGRRVPVWVPTLQKDFAAVSTSGSSPATLVVEGHDFTNFYQTHKARRDLALIYNDDSIICKRITSAALSGVNDELTITQVGALTLTNLRAVSFLKLSRLNEDKIGLVWHTDQLVEVTLNFIDLLTTP